MSDPALQPEKENACALCGLTLPSHPVADRSGRKFCCHGCAHVSAIIDEVGAESEAGRKALAAARQQGLISTETEKPHPVCELPESVREEKRMRVGGLACPSCAWLVEAVLANQPGVALAEVDYISDTVRVVYDLSKISDEDFAGAVSEAGYALRPLGDEGSGEWVEILRFALAVVVAVNLMMLAWVGYESFFTGTADPLALAIGWVQLIAAVPVVTWASMPLYRRALAALARGKVVMETLLSLGIIAASALSLSAILTGSAHTYLETATMLVAISLGGRLLERRLKRASASALTGMLQFSPTKARRDSDGRFEPLERFARGDLIRVEPGETVPLDLRLTVDSFVREGLLTGEPHPVARRAGDLVMAGSTVERGTLVGKVERSAGTTVADAIRDRVSEALRRADSGSRVADRLAQGFVPLVILIAVAAFVGNLTAGAEAMRAAMIAVSVLVVSCPCAFGVAASSALSLAVLRLANEGVLVKDPATLEKARSVSNVVFDKTGTLTRGELSLLQIGWIGPKQPELLDGIRALEEKSSHPFGIALSRLLPRQSESLPEAEGIIEVPGMGVTGTVSGRRLAAGKIDLFADPGRPLSEPPRGASRIWFGQAGEIPAGFADLADVLRDEAVQVVEALHSRGMVIELLSGDSQEPTASAAARAGIPSARGGLKPEEKAARINELREEGKVTTFVGDGFNDADALAAADIGIALAGGADLALVSAPVVITNGCLQGVASLFNIARRAAKVMRGNYIWAFVYNIALLPVAAFGLLAPVYAAGLMAVSSASVGINSMRVRSGMDS
jgi:Cu+-exporting ATPase